MLVGSRSVLGSFLGPFWGHFRTSSGASPGPILAQFWPHSGPFLAKFWPLSGSVLVPFWPSSGPFLAQFWPLSGPVLAPCWAQSWPHSGPIRGPFRGLFRIHPGIGREQPKCDFALHMRTNDPGL